MGCLVVLASAISPRFAYVLIWLFTDRASIAFNSFWIAAIGFIVLPWTTLAWVVAYAPIKGIEGFGWFIVLFAFLVDVASWGNSARRQQTSGYRFS